MAIGNSTISPVFNFTILLKSRKFDAREIYMFYITSEQVDFKVAIMAFWVLCVYAALYLSQLFCVAELPDRRQLGSSSTHLLLFPPSVCQP